MPAARWQMRRCAMPDRQVMAGRSRRQPAGNGRPAVPEVPPAAVVARFGEERAAPLVPQIRILTGEFFAKRLMFGECLEDLRPPAHNVAGEEPIDELERLHNHQQVGEAVRGLTHEVGRCLAQQPLLLHTRISASSRCTVARPSGPAVGVWLP